eukprot:TRINITY_DN3907_c0_g1_i1.p1 TRINITY_DN3907_c0_g1~~TRINITY_DN3907_c0_g1_i1.p1  ORF type:complete len:881 (+),score=163.93 TRINITY_DN3907_c0_g1_i1:359-2644(+)
MFQGWALGDFEVTVADTYLVSVSGVSQYYVDEILLKGDNYYANMATYPVFLSSGIHTFYIPFTGDEGASFNVGIYENPVSAIIPQYLIELIQPDIIVFADSTTLSAPYLTTSITNAWPDRWLENVSVAVSDPDAPVRIIEQSYLDLAPRQTRQLQFMAEIDDNITCVPIKDDYRSTFSFNITVSATSTLPIEITITLYCVHWGDPYSFTYIDFDGTVQYAAAWPPFSSCNSSVSGCPILITFHGASVVVGPIWTRSYQRQNYTWILYPTNRSYYGFDFQGPGRENSLKALDVFATTLPGVPSSIKNQYIADQYKLIYAGHSMGGHGCWAISTKHADRALAVAPAAGWIKMQFYLPYIARVGESFSSPYLLSILEASIAEDNTDFYTRNLVGLPLLVRMGGVDHNVPPYHLRRMARIVDQLSGNPNLVEVSEVPGKDHWFDGVVDGPVMQDFFNRNLKYTLPALPTQFTVSTMNPASFGGRGGMKILQFHIPYRAGFINVDKSGVIWKLKTQNIRRFGFYTLDTLEFPTQGIVLDGVQFSGPPRLLPEYHFCKLTAVSSWTYCNNASLSTERGPSTYGPLIQVLQGPLLIVFGTKGTVSQVQNRISVAVFISNFLWYQGRYSIRIVDDINLPGDYTHFNLLLLGGPEDNFLTEKIASTLPVSFAGRAFTIDGNTYFDTPKTGIAFLAPGLSPDRLLAVFSGTDDIGFQKSWQLLPMKSAETMPDYAVAGPTWGWQGSGGLLAAGFWSNKWEFDPNSGYIQTY